jgi:hypothetical protein
MKCASWFKERGYDLAVILTSWVLSETMQVLHIFSNTRAATLHVDGFSCFVTAIRT